MIHEFIETVHLFINKDLILFSIFSILIYFAIYYTFTLCHFILSHRVYKITNLSALIILAVAASIPEVNLFMLIFLPFVIIVILAIKIVYVMFVIFDVDIHNKSFCLILKIIINNIMHSSFRLI